MVWRRYFRSFLLLFFALSLLLLLHLINFKEEKPTEPQLNPHFGSFDACGKYKIHSHVRVASDWIQLSKEPLCLAVEASLENSFHLVNLVHSWPGSVSCALFTPGQEYSLTAAFLDYLHRCHPAIGRQVSIHLVHPVDRPPSDAVPVPELYLSCRLSASEVVHHLLRLRTNETLTWRQKMAYPRSLLSNVARAHCSTLWVMSPDIDMILPPSLVPKKLISFFDTKSAKKCKKCAFVLPVYEIDPSARHLPGNKSALLHLAASNKARPYQNQSLNQESTDLLRWAHNPGSEVEVAYPIENITFPYEPIFVAKRGMPPFDESSFVLTRSALAYEMLLGNYSFQVLNNVFLNRWGSLDDSNLKKLNDDQNSFFEHVRELVAKYDRDPLGLLEEHRGDQGVYEVVMEIRRSPSP